jgi:hypothetical protein
VFDRHSSLSLPPSSSPSYFSPWGDLLWDFLMGPLGFLLMLPFAFALLFWLLTYIFQ